MSVPKPSSSRKKRRYRYQRGPYCGLITTRFLADMVGLGYWTTRRLMKTWLDENDKIPREMIPKDIYDFVIYVYKCRNIDASALDDIEL